VLPTHTEATTPTINSFINHYVAGQPSQTLEPQQGKSDASEQNIFQIPVEVEPMPCVTLFHCLHQGVWWKYVGLPNRSFPVPFGVITTMIHATSRPGSGIFFRSLLYRLFWITRYLEHEQYLKAELSQCTNKVLAKRTDMEKTLATVVDEVIRRGFACTEDLLQSLRDRFYQNIEGGTTMERVGRCVCI
jgi:hypothetical protein